MNSVLTGSIQSSGSCCAMANACLCRRRHVCAYFVSMVHAALGEAGHALAWLERASEQGDWWLVWLGVEPRLAALRDDPRFVKLLRRVGLAALP